ncbi:hypothetical protein ONZ45_g2923 [Pleurotus djamor]|nr:hypothetical protein ONZ45_g2923 [Pleurotus djamor]
MSTSLPNEILSQIFHLLSDIASIRSITQASKQFLDLAEPILFRDVVFTCSSANVDPTPTEWSRYKLFCRKVASDDGRLGGHVLSLQIEGDRAQYFTTAFPFLSKLRRLEIYLHPNHLGVQFNPSVRLTHLTWNATPIPEEDDIENGGKHLLAILSSQPSLQYLKLKGYVDPAILEQLTPESLPSLRTLTCPTDEAITLLPICNINTFMAKTNNGFDLFHLTSKSITTLSYDRYDLPGAILQFSTCFPQLKQLIYLTTSQLALVDLGLSLSFSPEASNLEYICVQIDNTSISDGFTNALEKIPKSISQFPKLRTLDIVIFRNVGPSPCTRICFNEGVASPPVHFKRDVHIKHKWFEWWQVQQFGPIKNDIVFGRTLRLESATWLMNRVWLRIVKHEGPVKPAEALGCEVPIPSLPS